MHSEMEMFRCSIVRGGTSKGIFIMENELPDDIETRKKVIRNIFGSPDLRQIDGLGGADVLTSKLAIIGPSTRDDADVDYTFGQVSFENDTVDFTGNCGNISSGVGPFAIDAGLVAAKEPVTTVRIHMKNSGRVLTAEVPVEAGKAKVEGDFSIDGVPGTGAKIVLDWSDSVGAITGSLLPSGKAVDIVEAGGKKYEVSIVDAGNPLVFIRAADLNMSGTETPDEIESNRELMDTIEKIRGEAAVICGLVDKGEEARVKSPYIPFFSIVSEPADHVTFNGKKIKKEDTDIVARLLFMLKMHKTYPGTGTVATGAAACVPGSIVWELLGEKAGSDGELKIGHPAGIITVETESTNDGKTAEIKKIGIARTARKILDGFVYVRKSALK